MGAANRDTKGRFIKGNTASPGRPRGEREYLKAMIGAVSLEDWQTATGKMVQLAMAGDVNAFKAIAPYLAGLPAQKLELSASDTALLGEVLDRLKARNMSAGDVFENMLALLAKEGADHD